MNAKKSSLLVVILFFIFAFLFFLNKGANFPKKFKENTIHSVKIANSLVKVDLAKSEETRKAGLSGRTSLQSDQGMLFVFDEVGKYAFWMKEMNFPIDIIWIDQNLEVNYIKKNALPSSYPETFSPNLDSLYVLEVNAGFSERNNLKRGDKVEFLP